MSFTILSVAYPFAKVSPDAAGGSEQVLSLLDRALVSAGHRSIVIACQGSTVRGTLIETPPPPSEITDSLRPAAQGWYRSAIDAALRRYPIDLIHMHGLDFHAYIPSGTVPVLATLHLPPDTYPRHVFQFREPHWFVQCVSRSQASQCPPGSRMLDPIPNGIDLARMRVDLRKRGFLFTLGRICPEKGFHLALDAAKIAGLPLILAGEIFPYEAHRRYFEEELRPRFDHCRRFIGPVGLRAKRRLMTQARCLLVPSLVEETSSLVVMEAFACGTPVIAFRHGALPELIEEGVTGFIVDDTRQMAEALHHVDELDPQACLRKAYYSFSSERMVRQYMQCYASLIQGLNGFSHPMQTSREAMTPVI